MATLLYISSLIYIFTDTLPASKLHIQQTMAINKNIEKAIDCPTHPAWFNFEKTNEKHLKFLSPHLDMTSSQKEGNRTRRCGHLSLFSSIARPLFKTGCSGRADAVSG